ncbi:DNA-directed RNA polymerase III subunit RPC3 [Pleurostoma richardsiae]|uniref:DNA-directed RNA polymerase III subunit RPC3 n=1 Tax=Pleurostoma richardsiae TaxID=41990 RepID=A0AA38VFY2_9PEZI|nr:DNA-directed RNA polymerase III subunit RPC3 [Pleurostoma richardsiae]
MQVTKNLAELCALLIDDIYGELPSRIFATLLNKGRSTIQQLAQQTALTPRQLRHGLAVLIQHGLLYYYVDNDLGMTAYDASAEGAYNLVRTGRILAMVESVYGPAEKDVLQSLLLLGHTQIADLKAAYEAKINARARVPNGSSFDEDGGEHRISQSDLVVESLEHLNSALCRLIEAELVVVVSPVSFRSPEDTYKDIEAEVLSTYFPGGVRGGKGKDEFARRLAERLGEARDEPKKLKRKLQQNGAVAAIKRRKVVNGDVANGTHGSYNDPPLDPKTVLRINYEKCLVDLRNEQLAKAASEFVGETTAAIYDILLRLLGKKVARCVGDLKIDGLEDDDESPDVLVTTMDLLDNLPTSVDVGSGIGKVKASRTDRRSAEKVQERPPHIKTFADEAEVEGDASSDEEEIEDESDGPGDSQSDGEKPNGHNSPATKVNGTKNGRVKFQDDVLPKQSRVDQMRQHLLLLCETKQRFLRHCGPDKWTVDFEPLISNLRESELDTVIEQTVGREGLRLVRILQQKGKMDEKTLPSIALMPKNDVQKKMLEMEMLGYVDMQEVPRDTNRTASRTMFLYWRDTQRCLDRLLDNTYKAMVRCLQRLDYHRQQEREVLEIVKRADVRGREQQVMEKRYYDKFVKVIEIQQKILGHVMRLDELVGILRDF